MERQYHYYAFISYSHEDRRWARRIQRELEAFRLPSVLQGEKKDLPERIRPVFLDASDLGVGKLREKLHAELEQSKYLIVVCSPRSAVPNAEGAHWVDSEVAHFLGCGREDRIIPVIVEGTPQTAFCPALRKAGILALDAVKTPRRRIISDIVAKILGLAPDDLWRREQRRWRRKMLLRSLAISLQTFIAGFLIWYVVDWNIEKIRYFRRSNETFGFQADNPGLPSSGLAEGAFEIEKHQLPFMQRAYRFHYQGYTSLLPWNRKPMLRKFFNVNASDSVLLDEKGRRLHSLSAGRKYSYDDTGRISIISAIDKDGIVVTRGEGVARVVNTYDDLGRIKEIRFLDIHERPTVPPAQPYARLNFEYLGNNTNIWKAVEYFGNGSFVIAELNHNGKPISDAMFNQDGTPTKNNLGVYRTVYQYNPKSGNEERREYHDENGNPMPLPRTKIIGFASRYDNDSNLSEIQYFGQGNVCVTDSTGIAKIVYQYTNGTFRVKEDCYGPENQRRANAMGVSGIRREFDDKGRITTEWVVDTNENHYHATGFQNGNGESHFRLVFSPKRRLSKVNF